MIIPIIKRGLSKYTSHNLGNDCLLRDSLSTHFDQILQRSIKQPYFVKVRGPFGLVSTIEELLGRKSSGSGLESRGYGGRDPSRWSRGSLYPQMLALTLPTSGGLSVGIVLSRTQATEFSLLCKRT
jgi:hypothetical protein